MMAFTCDAVHGQKNLHDCNSLKGKLAAQSKRQSVLAAQREALGKYVEYTLIGL